MESIGNILKRIIPELFGDSLMFRVIYEKDGRKHTAYIMAKNQKEARRKLKKHTIVKIEQYNPQLGVGA
jgi:hypothetical protein